MKMRECRTNKERHYNRNRHRIAAAVSAGVWMGLSAALFPAAASEEWQEEYAVEEEYTDSSSLAEEYMAEAADQQLLPAVTDLIEDEGRFSGDNLAEIEGISAGDYLAEAGRDLTGENLDLGGAVGESSDADDDLAETGRDFADEDFDVAEAESTGNDLTEEGEGSGDDPAETAAEEVSAYNDLPETAEDSLYVYMDEDLSADGETSLEEVPELADAQIDASVTSVPRYIYFPGIVNVYGQELKVKVHEAYLRLEPDPADTSKMILTGQILTIDVYEGTAGEDGTVTFGEPCAVELSLTDLPVSIMMNVGCYAAQLDPIRVGLRDEENEKDYNFALGLDEQGIEDEEALLFDLLASEDRNDTVECDYPFYDGGATTGSPLAYLGRSTSYGNSSNDQPWLIYRRRINPSGGTSTDGSEGKTGSEDKPVVTPTVKLNRSSISMTAGSTYSSLSAYGMVSGDYVSCWSSSNSAVVSVNAANGSLTAKATGTARITVRTRKGATASITVTVKPASVPTTSITTRVTTNPRVHLNYSALTLKKNQISALKASGLISGDAIRSWTSSRSSVAAVTKTGSRTAKLTAKKAGTAVVTVRTNKGASATVRVTVKRKTAKPTLSVSPASLTMKTKQKKKLSAYGMINGDRVVSWRSGNTGVVTVSSSGMLKAKKKGSAVITVTTKKGAIKKVSVTVRKK